VPTVAMAVIMGVVPVVFMRPMEPSVNRVVERVTGRQPAQVMAQPLPPVAQSSQPSPQPNAQSLSHGEAR